MSLRLRWVLLPLLGLSCSERPIPEPIPDGTAQRYAEALCASVQDCGCGYFESSEACEVVVAEQFDAIAGGLRDFDQECFDAFLASGAYESCGTPQEARDLFPDCAAFYGSAVEGESCIPNALFGDMNPTDTCVEGVDCYFVTGVCDNDPPFPDFKSEGDICSEALTNNCFNEYLYCDEGVCRQRAECDEPCTHVFGCHFGFCQGLQEDGEGICTPRLDFGDPCDPKDYYSCDPPLGGDYGWCSPTTQHCKDTIPYACQTILQALGPSTY
ncbi:hypothetical protein G6O69_38025 [Pseudenhygromyxa sp. WMMC2535]|uniref:hypothetical protein n=1 Tax=Pseudenhygromyxa sp. WMMC2535 TaxID=2712867 RepID=UPI0015574BAB|nr:hypothetical protein [Pseudenhygromyxa sp. WMMC2535]NVB38221.1 hypothetical protein [Pseudenhygromyxa sp. WMMC2535]NVB41620.1 hypothetical protein [Pseudenhygromyxa sp. WMMC2535]NVB43644.1 hypothetical protein [Pseudenhygromyxa sp. WMMC2535]NVB43669.1 hypothetical protein [Pseudenhygromyxa sp. WMMC2535]